MKDNVVRIGVIGYGHWGPNHVRNFSLLDGSEVLFIGDLDKKRLAAARKAYPSVRTTRDYRDILRDKNVDAVVVATPTKTHYRLAREALERGKHVLCEKPLTVRPWESERLIEIARKNKRFLMVGHVFIYNPGIQRLHDYIKDGSLGRIYYISCKRTNLGPIRNDVNVIYDLASHDVSICNFLLGSNPTEVSARGSVFLRECIEDVAFISMIYPRGELVNIHVSWLDPQKIRQITVVGNKKMACWDDLSHTSPIWLYDKGVVREPYYEDFAEFQFLPLEKDVLIPKIKMIEPVRNQSRHFIECILNNKRPLSDGKNGLDVVRVLSAIQASMKKKGKTIRINN